MRTGYRIAVFAASAAWLPLCAAQEAAISIQKAPQGAVVRYASGGSVYVEQMSNQAWVARQWTFEPAAGAGSGNLASFDIGVRTTPSSGETKLAAWKFVQARELPGSGEGRRHAEVELASTQLPVGVKIHTVLDGTPVLTRWLEITNRSGRSIALTSLSVWAGDLWSGKNTVDLGYATREYCCWEGWFGWKPLTAGRNVLRQQHGLSYDHPYFVLRNEAKKEFFFGQLEWPLNRVMEFDNGEGVSFRAGPTADNALRVIATGETVTTPLMDLEHVQGDFDAAVQAMHDHVRRSVVYRRPAERSYRIECLMPEDQPMTVYRGAEFNQANIEKFMDVLSQIGVELLIVDGPTWASNYGEWLKPQPKEFPNGLKPLVDYAHRKKLLFGLYSEPEGGRNGYTSANHGLTIGRWENTAVYKQHPDWFVQGVVINLANPAAAAYVQSEIEGMIRHYGLDLYRHDFNTPMQGEGSVTERDGFVESDYWRHYEAFFRIFERIHAEFPELMLQQASAGGTRLDLGTVRRFPEDYTSDRTSMPYVYRMLAGMSVYLPPEALVTPIGMAPPEERPDLDTMLRSIYAMGNTPMVFNSLVPRSPADLTPEIRDKFLHYTKLYNDFIRPLMPVSKVYHLAPVNETGSVGSGDWFAMDFVSPDRTKGWALVIRMNKDASAAYQLKPRGLDPAKTYAITLDANGTTQTASGAALARDGLRIAPGASTYSELLLFTAK